MLSCHRVILALSLTVICSGCVVVQPPQPQGANNGNSSAANIRRTEEPKVTTIADAVQTCKNIQEAQDIPVGCVTKYFDGKPAMYFVFENMDLAESWIKPLAEYVA